MKTIKTILDLVAQAKERAERNPDGTGYAVLRRKYTNGYMKDNPEEVYRVEYIKNGLAGDIANLFHYETHTAEVWLCDVPQVMHVYGESRTDADSINTFLARFGAKERYTFRPVNGGFQEMEAN